MEEIMMLEVIYDPEERCDDCGEFVDDCGCGLEEDDESDFLEETCNMGRP